jgi:hypothetical protein
MRHVMACAAMLVGLLMPGVARAEDERVLMDVIVVTGTAWPTTAYVKLEPGTMTLTARALPGAGVAPVLYRFWKAPNEPAIEIPIVEAPSTHAIPIREAGDYRMEFVIGSRAPSERLGDRDATQVIALRDGTLQQVAVQITWSPSTP